MHKNGWEQHKNALIKEFRFQDFKSAVEFVNRVAGIAEVLNHHPDIYIYSYKNVRIATTTHDEAKITEKDNQLAEMIDKIEA